MTEEDQRVLALAEQAGLAYPDRGLWCCAIMEDYDITDELLKFAELVKQEKV